MSSFYGNGGGTSSKVINSLNKKAKRHIVASESEPFDQQIGDLWLVLEKDENENKTRVDLTYNTAEGIFEGQIDTGIMTAAQLEEGYDFYGEIDGNEVSFMVAEITDQPDCTLIKLFSPMVEGIVECGYYYKTGRITKRLRAILDDGDKVNLKMRRLSGQSNPNSNMYIGTQNTQIKSILMVEENFENFIPTEENTISTSESDIPIYIKYNNESIQIYTEANKIQTTERLKGLCLNLKNLVNISGLQSINTFYATDLSQCFVQCLSLVDISPITNWNVKNVTNMSNLFWDNSKLVNFDPISNWNVQNLQNLTFAFGYSGLTNLNAFLNWDTRNLRVLDFAFCGTKIQNVDGLTNWNVRNLEDQRVYFGLQGIFSQCSKLENVNGLSNWVFPKVKRLTSLFSNCSNLMNITGLENWDVSNCITLSAIFDHCSKLSDITPLMNWDVSNCIEMIQMFRNCSSLKNINSLSNWNTSKVTSVREMFYNCPLNEVDLTSLNLLKFSNIDNAYRVFANAKIINIDLSNWDISKIDSIAKNSYQMQYASLVEFFANCSELVSVNLSGWDFANVKNMTKMFANTPKLENVYVTQDTYDSFLNAVDNGCNITDMWKNSKISQFTIIDS